MCVSPDHLPSKYALLHPNLGDGLPHLPHNLRADNKFILTGWVSFPGLLQGRFCDISLNNRFAGRHWRTLQKLWVHPSHALLVPHFIGYASIPPCSSSVKEYAGESRRAPRRRVPRDFRRGLHVALRRPERMKQGMEFKLTLVTSIFERTEAAS